MKTPNYRDIVAATKLTRAGNLAQATALLQTSLNAGAALESGSPRAAADTPKPGGRYVAKTYRNEAGSRSYKLYVPSSYDGRECPLVVMLHGCTQSADDFSVGTRMNELAEEFNFLVAYPEQPSSANPRKCWNWFLTADQQRDRGEPSLIAGITRQIMSDYAIDRHRVYVAGLSAGAAAAAVLGATYPDVYAAIGVHSGIARGLAHDVNSALAVMKRGPDAAKTAPAQSSNGFAPAIVFHGDRDKTVHNANGDRFAGELTAPATAKRLEVPSSPGNRAYTKTTYTNANGNDVLELWDVHGAGHAWSGGNPAGSFTDVHGPDASREMLRFFLSHKRS